MQRKRFLALAGAALCLIVSANAASRARIIKVLPHYLDKQGRHTLSPSLYERDAYQYYLRRHPEERGALRYDIQWTANRNAKLILRLELQGSEEYQDQPLVLEQAVTKKGWFSRWNAIPVKGDNFEEIGEVVAWRVTLWDGDRLLAEQRSFLWQRESHAPPKPNAGEEKIGEEKADET